MRGSHAFALAATVAATLALLPLAPGDLRADDASSTPSSPPQNTAPSPSPPEQQPSQQQAPATVIVLNKHEVQGVLGREVLSAANENMGRIVDVLVDSDGRVHAAIIDFGGFLGVGSRKIAVDWDALHFPIPAKSDQHVTLDLTRDQVNAAPAYEDGKPAIVLGALGKLEPLPYE